jgi:hypothetical protein
MNTNDFTPEESFDIIKKAISNSKMNYKENSQVFLLWGWILTLASFSSFFLLKFLNGNEAYELTTGIWAYKGLFFLGNWLLFCLAGFIIMYFMVRKINKNKKIISHIDKFVNNLWWVTMASFFIAIFICVKMDINPPLIMLLIAGIATTTTGLTIKFKPLILGGMTFFIFSIASTFITNEYSTLIVSAAILCGYVIPGYFLKSAKE